MAEQIKKWLLKKLEFLSMAVLAIVLCEAFAFVFFYLLLDVLWEAYS